MIIFFDFFQKKSSKKKILNRYDKIQARKTAEKSLPKPLSIVDKAQVFFKILDKR